MKITNAYTVPLWTLPVYFVIVIILIAGLLVLSHFLGQRKKERTADEPYESGIVSTGSARLRFNVRFYLVAMIFIIFDLESIFIVAWAVSFHELGWQGYVEIVVFIGVFLAILFYLARTGVLEWVKKSSNRHFR